MWCGVSEDGGAVVMTRLGDIEIQILKGDLRAVSDLYQVEFNRNHPTSAEAIAFELVLALHAFCSSRSVHSRRRGPFAGQHIGPGALASNGSRLGRLPLASRNFNLRKSLLEFIGTSTHTLHLLWSRHCSSAAECIDSILVPSVLWRGG